MTVLVTDLCTAIAADIRATGDLPTDYFEWLHVPPDELGSEQTPWLAVYTPGTDHTLESTEDQYLDDHTIEVEWAVSIADQAELGGIGDPDIAAAAVAVFTPVIDRMRGYAAGVPGETNQIQAVLVATARRTGPALVYRQTVTLRVSQLP